VTEATRQYEVDLGSDVIQSLLKNYGSKFGDVTRLFYTDKTLAQRLDGTNVIRAEIIHAVREEMAQKMSDVVFRRTDLGTAGYPGKKALNSCLKIITEELEWNEGRAIQEYSEVKATFNNLRNNAYRDSGVS
jgi:glycerol-3-phosphate dehydrogenase